MMATFTLRRFVPVLAVTLALVGVISLALIYAGTAPVPAGAQDDYEPDQQLIANVWDYAAETNSGFDHVLRWMRVLKTFGVVQDMSAAEAQENADQYWAARWDPVVAELQKLERAPDDYEPDQQLIANVWDYARETDSGFDHVLRWMRVLKTFGVVEDMTAAEARAMPIEAGNGGTRWWRNCRSWKHPLPTRSPRRSRRQSPTGRRW